MIWRNFSRFDVFTDIKTFIIVTFLFFNLNSYQNLTVDLYNSNHLTYSYRSTRLKLCLALRFDSIRMEFEDNSFEKKTRRDFFVHLNVDEKILLFFAFETNFVNVRFFSNFSASRSEFGCDAGRSVVYRRHRASISIWNKKKHEESQRFSFYWLMTKHKKQHCWENLFFLNFFSFSSSFVLFGR